MKVPCKDCLILAICRQKIKDRRNIPLIFCSLINKYVYDRNLRGKERPMYRYTRVNKVRKALGLKKGRHRNS